jgi:hypothetical protein
MLNKLGIKDVYKRFKSMESGFMDYIYLAKERYDFNACRPWVTKKGVNDDGHIVSVLSHKIIVVPVNMNNV